MPDDIPPRGERPYEPRLATEACLEFIMGQIAKLPTRRDVWRAALLGALTGAGLVIICIELFRRVCL
jgi:hypothetical protein